MADVQNIIADSRVAHMRELKSEVARLREENLHLKSELQSLSAHFDFALVAAEDLRNLPPEGKMFVFDGWNLVLGAGRVAADRAALKEYVRGILRDNPGSKAWIVFDGRDENVRADGDIRVSYTGGTGAHRADRLICDYLRMAVYLGLGHKVEVRTDDRDFLKTVARIKGGRDAGVLHGNR